MIAAIKEVNMKRYGDNLPSDHAEEFENSSCKAQYMPAGCAVRQDMVAFMMPVDVPNNHKAWNIFSFSNLGKRRPRRIAAE